MAGYQRQDTTGKIATGQPIDADIFNDEYDAIAAAMNASSGHSHDGTAGGGAPIESIGPSQELEVESGAVFPYNNNLIDSGKSTQRWKDGWFGGTVNSAAVTASGDVSVGGNLTVTGDATISGNLIFGDAVTDTVNFNADIDSNVNPEQSGVHSLGTSTQQWNNLWLDGTANVDTLTVDENATIAGTLGVTGATGIDGDFDINSTKFTVAAASGNTDIAGVLNVTGSVTFSDTLTVVEPITATGGVVGNSSTASEWETSRSITLTGDVTGTVTGVNGGANISIATTIARY